MAALDKALRTNPHRLLFFAALKDFSGENISFLTKVLEWKRRWSPASPANAGFARRPSAYGTCDKKLQRQQFKEALDIYTTCVSPRYSDYPINLSHVHLKELETVFEGATMMIHTDICPESGSATPFDRLWHGPTSEDVESYPVRDGISFISTQRTNATNNSTDHILDFSDGVGQHTILQNYEMTKISDRLPDFIPIPCGFGPNIFDRAEESIKYMVLTNTWPKFVNDTNSTNTKTRKKTLFDRIQSRLPIKGT